jgi:methionyl aminopeptidase
MEETVREGISLQELDRIAEEHIRSAGARPAFLHYQPSGASHPYPATICASVNDVVVHGIPSGYKLKNGDIVSIDVGVNWRGGFSDAAITLPVGTVSEKAITLMRITKDALRAGIEISRAGNTIGDIGHAIDSATRAGNAHVMKHLTGHGVGLAVHEEPTIFNYGTPGQGMILKPGMVIALEPMTSFTTSHVIQDRETEGYVTADRSLSAHFEHTIIITEGDPIIATLRKNDIL